MEVARHRSSRRHVVQLQMFDFRPSRALVAGLLAGVVLGAFLKTLLQS